MRVIRKSAHTASKYILLLTLLLCCTFHPGYTQNGSWKSSVTLIPTQKLWAHSGAAVDGKIYIFGGYEQKTEDFRLSICQPEILVYYPEADLWQTKLRSLIPARAWASAVSFQNDIYIIGGYGDYHNWYSYSQLNIYHSESDSWNQKAKPMSLRRHGSAACVLGGKIYCIGGAINSELGLKKVEVYDPINNTWVDGKDLLQARAYFATLTINEKIFAIGGSWNEREKPLRSIEVYDPVTNIWDDSFARIPYEIFQFGSCVYRGKIYLFGGRSIDDNSHLTGRMYNTVLMYDPLTAIWLIVSEMPRGRAACTAHVINDNIYIVGGYDASVDPENSLDAWFPEVDVYSPVKEPIYAVNSRISGTCQEINTEALHIQSSFVNHKNHSFKAVALSTSFNKKHQYQTPLYDDGMHGDKEPNDGIYGNYLSEIYIESHFSVDILTTNHELNEMFTTKEATASFTTIGPIKFEKITISDDGSSFTLQLKNNSISAQADDITAEIWTSDDQVILSQKTLQFSDINPGKIASSINSINFEKLENYQEGKTLKIHIAISSKQSSFWNNVAEIRLDN